MGGKISIRNSSYKSQPKAFKIFLNFLPNFPHKTTFGNSEILKIEILTNIFRKYQIHHGTYGETKTLNYLENDRS